MWLLFSGPYMCRLKVHKNYKHPPRPCLLTTFDGARLAAPNSFRSLVVCPSVCLSVSGVGEKVTFRKWVSEWVSDKTQIVTQLKLWQKSNCNKTLIMTKLKLWQYSYLTKMKLWQTHKLWQNSYCDKTQTVKKLK